MCDAGAVTERGGPEAILARGGAALRARLLAGGLALAAIVALANVLSLEQRLGSWLAAARGAGAAGLALHAGAYLVAALLGLPVSPLTVAAGAAYGPLAGAALAVPSSTIAGCAAFLVGRVIARDPERIACGTGRVARAARAIGRGGVRLVVLLRLAPVVPFSVLNFAFGATPTRLVPFALGSFLGTIPSQLCYAWLGAVLARPAGPERTRAEIAVVAIAVLLTAAATAGAVALLRRRGARPS